MTKNDRSLDITVHVTESMRRLIAAKDPERSDENGKASRQRLEREIGDLINDWFETFTGDGDNKLFENGNELICEMVASYLTDNGTPADVQPVNADGSEYAIVIREDGAQPGQPKFWIARSDDTGADTDGWWMLALFDTADPAEDELPMAQYALPVDSFESDEEKIADAICGYIIQWRSQRSS